MYIIEGNMGVGKTTFLSLIQAQCPDIFVHFEPRENWTNDAHGQSLLEHFFQDKKRWEFTAETFIMLCRVKEHQKVEQYDHCNLIMERSIYSGHYCYARAACALGLFTRLEWHIYNKFAEYLINDSTKPPQGFIYLRSDPRTCFTRVKKRNWKCEQEAPQSFIEQLHVWHEKFLIDRCDIFANLKRVPILILDANKDFESDATIQQEFVQKVREFMNHSVEVGRCKKPSVRGGKLATFL